MFMLFEPDHNKSEATSKLGLAVFISSKGRAEELGKTLETVQRQSLLPSQIILSVTDESDLPQSVTERFNAFVCMGPPGKTAQQNRGLSLLFPSIEIVAFLDDDVELTTSYLETVHQVFLKDPDLVGLSGHVFFNGGVSRAEAREFVAHDDLPKKEIDENPKLIYNNANQGLYGCCMSLRKRVFNHIQFDERLPLYSWLEDADIGIRAQAHGRCGYCPSARLIHLGINSGRISGLKFGFSQIMNPVYLATRGVLSWSEVFFTHLTKVLLANILGLIRLDQQVDRWGRLHGNFLALSHWMRGKIEPEKILNL